jgi:hypothetical protein
VSEPITYRVAVSADGKYSIEAGECVLEAAGLRRTTSGLQATVTARRRGQTVARDLLNLNKATSRRKFAELLKDYGVTEDALLKLALAADEALTPDDHDANGSLQGEPITFDDPEPWPDPVSLAEVLSEMHGLLTKHVIMQGGAADAVVLWVVHTYVMDAWQITPFLLINSPVKQCGKSTLLEVLSTLTIRTVGDDHEPRQFSTWAPKVVALIGTLLEHHDGPLCGDPDAAAQPRRESRAFASRRSATA